MDLGAAFLIISLVLLAMSGWELWRLSRSRPLPRNDDIIRYIERKQDDVARAIVANNKLIKFLGEH